MIKTKRKGSCAEREVKALLEKRGYFCSKAGGSLGLWDIIAINEREIKLIQVKSSEKPFRSASWREEIKKMEKAQNNIPDTADQEFWIRRWGGMFENWVFLPRPFMGKQSWHRCSDIGAGAIIK